MNVKEIPDLLNNDVNSHFESAANSERRRSPKILHNKGDYHNKVFNFILEDSYMHPHLHPGEEKIEKMYYYWEFVGHRCLFVIYFFCC